MLPSLNMIYQLSDRTNLRDCVKVFPWTNAVENLQELDGKWRGDAWYLTSSGDRKQHFLEFRGWQ
ncbi:MAG: hypothetical protein ACE5I1_09565 [bacterium]